MKRIKDPSRSIARMVLNDAFGTTISVVVLNLQLKLNDSAVARARRAISRRTERQLAQVGAGQCWRHTNLRFLLSGGSSTNRFRSVATAPHQRLPD